MRRKVQPEKEQNENEPNVLSAWKLNLSNFLKDTSLHGCKNISVSGSLLVRFFWGMTVLSMTALLMYSLIQFYAQYHQYKVVTRVTKEIRQEIPFPTVVVCNRSPFNREHRNLTSVEIRFLQATGSAGVLFPNINWNGPDGDALDQVDFPAFWEQGSASVRDTIKILEFKGKGIPISSTHITRTLGVYCSSFNLPSLDSDSMTETVSKADEGIFIVIDVMQHKYVPGMSHDSGVKVLFHDPETSHLWEADTRGVGVGSSVIMVLQRKEISFLGYPYNSRGADCMDVKSPDFVNPLRWFRNYSYSGCVTECANKRAMELCNCTAAWQPLGADATKSTRCDCLYPCEMISFDIQASSQAYPTGESGEVLANISGFPSAKYMRENVLVFEVKYGSMIVDKAVHEPELLLDDIFGRLGGQMGLFLGASLITISELLQFILVGIIKTVKRLIYQ